MRKTNLTAVMIVIVTMLAMTSCLKDNPSEETKYVKIGMAEKHTIMNAITGQYVGKTKYTYIKEGRYLVDSIATRIEITPDTMLDIKGLPLKAITALLPIGEDQKALDEAKTQEIKTKLVIPVQELEEYYNKGLYRTLIKTDGMTKFTTPKGKEVVIEFAETLPVPNSPYGQYYLPMLSAYKNQIEGFILIKAVSVDKNKYEINQAINFAGKK